MPTTTFPNSPNQQDNLEWHPYIYKSQYNCKYQYYIKRDVGKASIRQRYVMSNHWRAANYEQRQQKVDMLRLQDNEHYRTYSHYRKNLKQHTCTYLVLVIVQAEMNHTHNRQYSYIRGCNNVRQWHSGPFHYTVKLNEFLKMVWNVIHLSAIYVIGTNKPIRHHYS